MDSVFGIIMVIGGYKNEQAMVSYPRIQSDVEKHVPVKSLMLGCG